jgi:uncharacterized protein (TIGR03118 family)
MPACHQPFRWLACAAALVLTACGGGDGNSGAMPAPSGTSVTSGTSGSGYAATNLVSDLAAASNPYGTSKTDAHLVNAWGVAFNPQGFVWVADNGTSNSTLYDGNGVPQTLVVAIPPGNGGNARPTGIVFNGQQSFKVTQNGVTGASAFIFAGQAGTVSGWSPGVNRNSAITVVDDAAAGNIYTGLAIGSRGGSDFLYAADFRHATVNVFDANFARTSVAGAFTDPTLPTGYAPYGIQALGDRIYVAYAKQDGSARDAVAGAGLGLIDAFDTAGNLVQRVVAAGGVLNAPWGMAMAPANFGPLSNALLVASSGDGQINAFNPTTGALLGVISAADDKPIAIDGLRGIAFGNGLNSQPANTLFFAAGPSSGTHGVYGRIDSR